MAAASTRSLRVVSAPAVPDASQIELEFQAWLESARRPNGIGTLWAALVRASRLCLELNGQRSFAARAWRQFRWYLLVALQPRAALRWFRTLDQPGMRGFAANHPQLVVKPLRPYLSRRWKLKRRCQVIQHSHDVALSRPVLAAALTRPGGVRLLHGSLPGETPFEIRIGRDQRFRKEGELVLSLRDSWQGQPLCSLSLAFERGPYGTVTCYIGSLQGREGSGAEMKAFAKACHGLRPTVLLVHAAQQVARLVGADTLLGVGNDIQVHRRKHLMYIPFLHRLHHDYDQLWKELGAQPDGQGWHLLPLELVRRTRDEVPARKRAQYERRYRWMDKITAELRETLVTA